MKQKKKQNVNSKFNFDDEYIIGVSNSASPNKTKSKTSNKNGKNTTKSKKTNKRPQMNEKRKKIAANVVKMSAVLCLFVGAGCFLCLSPTFNVQEIIVENNEQLPADTIRSLSKIELYKNIFLLDKSKIVENIQKNANIEKVKVQRELPNKIKIYVEERKEEYLLQFAEGKYAILDGQGYILGTTSETKELTILSGAETNIEDLVKNTGNKNRLCEKDLKKLDMVTNIIQTTKNYEVFSFITRIDISDIDNIKLVLDGEGKIVHLGSCTDLSTRILYMKDILNYEKGVSGEIFINGNLSEDRVYFRENV